MPAETKFRKKSWSFWHKEDYEGDTNEKNCNKDSSRSDNENFVKNVGQRTRV